MSETTTLALVVLSFLVVALAVLTMLSILPSTETKARALWPVMISEIAIVAAALGLVVPGGATTAVGLALLAARCGWEATTVALAKAGPGAALAVGAAAGIAALLADLGGPAGVAAGIVLVAFAAMLAARRTGPAPEEGVLLLLFPLAALVAFAHVAARPEGGATLLLAFVLVETMDSAAVLGGRLWGRRQAFPNLSPRKTIEGLAAGAAALTFATFVLGLAVMDWSVARILAVAAVSAVSTVAGDLVASLIKRRAGVKDYPPIHPVQGGVLDIVDAWIVTAPALAFVAAFP